MFARISALAVATVLAACEGKPPRRYVTVAPTLAKLRLRLPADAAASYDVTTDRWMVATPTEAAMIDRAPAASVASPEALRHDLVEREHHWPRAMRVTITARESLSDGFTTTFSVGDHLESVVVREVGSVWLRCFGSLSLCKSLKRA